jgi:hypothetical protein
VGIRKSWNQIVPFCFDATSASRNMDFLCWSDRGDATVLNDYSLIVEHDVARHGNNMHVDERYGLGSKGLRTTDNGADLQRPNERNQGHFFISYTTREANTPD